MFLYIRICEHVRKYTMKQCLLAKLRLHPPKEDAEAQWVEVERGLVICVFSEEADKELLSKSFTDY